MNNAVKNFFKVLAPLILLAIMAVAISACGNATQEYSDVALEDNNDALADNNDVLTDNNDVPADNNDAPTDNNALADDNTDANDADENAANDLNLAELVPPFSWTEAIALGYVDISDENIGDAITGISTEGLTLTRRSSTSQGIGINIAQLQESFGAYPITITAMASEEPVDSGLGLSGSPAGSEWQSSETSASWTRYDAGADTDRAWNVPPGFLRVLSNDDARSDLVITLTGITVGDLNIIDLAAVPPTEASVFLDWDLTLPPLAESFQDFFWLGNIWSNHGQMSERSTEEKYFHHYNQITASNMHKISFILNNNRDAWQFNWETTDHIVNWAEENDLAMVWHTLVWHTQSRLWLTNDADGNVLTREQAMYNLHRYISTVASRYAGRILSYDVVNEVIWGVDQLSGWNANPNWRNHMRRAGRGIGDGDQASFWYDAFANGADTDAGECGSDYIFYAFKFTRMYDPFAILYYNDYNEQTPGKRQAIAQMVEEINERWRNHELYDGRLLIEGIGMQTHRSIRGWMPDPNLVRDSIIRFAETGARISVTELNVYIAGGGIADTIDPELYPNGGLQALYQEQAEMYYTIFNFYLEFQNYIERVTWFIWQDLPAQQGAWRRWPFSQRPALFDKDRQAKPAFWSVLEALENHTPNISVPVVTDDVLTHDIGERGVGMQFSAIQNNHAPIFWRVTEGSLPPGMSLVSTTGTVLGIPTQHGDFTFNIAAENSLGTGTKVFTISVGAETVITPGGDIID
ncbi:MAG: endo-1,4-beta-xylanase [Defluviitaleaceae bacterium]|nr:endo-1,4-beta-xylanase [Defluviitaleaceae bacterium]